MRSTTLPFEYIPNHFVGADDILWTKGAHSFKFGILVDRIRYNTNNPFQGAGSWTFQNLPQFLSGTALQFNGPLPGQTDSVRDYRELMIQPYFHDEWKVSSRLTVNLGLRYDWAVNPTEARHGITNILTPPYGAGYVPVDHIFVKNPTNRNWAPRVGIAYDPFRDHKTSIRAGFGMFYDIMQAREYIFGYSLSPPFNLGTKLNAPYGPAFSGGGTPNLPNSNSGQDYQSTHTPYMMQFNFNIQRDIGGGTILSMGYVGSAGVHLLSTRERNPPTPVLDANGIMHFADPVVNASGVLTGILAHPRLNPLIGSLTMKNPDSHSKYHSLQIGLNRRFSKGLQMQVSYTWSRSLDASSQSIGLESTGSPGAVMNPFLSYLDYSRSDFDRTHTFRINSVYAIPLHQNKLVEGWQLSGILSMQSGGPFTITSGFDMTGFATNAAGRPNLNSGRTIDDIILRQPTKWFDPTAFSLQPVGTFGNLGRNIGIGPRLINADLALTKDTRIARISETFNVQFRAEIFNIFNHANFGLPAAALYSNVSGAVNPTAGVITTTVTPSRQMQFALKFIF